MKTDLGHRYTAQRPPISKGISNFIQMLDNSGTHYEVFDFEDHVIVAVEHLHHTSEFSFDEEGDFIEMDSLDNGSKYLAKHLVDTNSSPLWNTPEVAGVFESMGMSKVILEFGPCCAKHG